MHGQSGEIITLALGQLGAARAAIPRHRATCADPQTRLFWDSYFGFAPAPSSSDDSGTYSRPPSSVGAPVIRVSGCESARFVHTTTPVSAFSA